VQRKAADGRHQTVIVGLLLEIPWGKFHHTVRERAERKELMRRWYFLCITLAVSVILPAGEKITIGLRVVPPYVEQRADGSGSGLEYDVIAAAFSAAGYEPVVKFFPLARLHESFRAGIVQAAAPVGATIKLDGFLSDIYLLYHNRVFMLKSNDHAPAVVADLKTLRVLAFQTAHSILGPSLAAVAANNPLYAETGKQITQINMLFAGRVDAVICDEKIFYHYLSSKEASVRTSDSVRMFSLFPPTEYRVIFSKKNHADAFNRGLKIIRTNGVYGRLLAKYSYRSQK
jgi:polar amino acid transport system substrate-binding protein